MIRGIYPLTKQKAEVWRSQSGGFKAKSGVENLVKSMEAEKRRFFSQLFRVTTSNTFFPYNKNN